MNTMTYRGYTARIEYDDSDRIFVGRLAGRNVTNQDDCGKAAHQPDL